MSTKTTGWQQIETAPKDGTWVLLGWPPIEGHFGPSIIIAHYSDGDWFKSGWGYGLGHVATHWMPLPDAPSDDSSPWSKPMDEWGVEDVERAVAAELGKVS